MSIRDIILAWKDSTYRNSLSDEQRLQLPSYPVGEVLSEEELQGVSGGGDCDTDANGGCSCSISYDVCVTPLFTIAMP